MAKAMPLFDQKIVYEDGAILQMRIWAVPEPVRGSGHSLKYSLFYGRPGERVLAYDNEAGEGDHVHRGPVATPYAFSSPDRLMADFLAEVRVLRGGAI